MSEYYILSDRKCVDEYIKIDSGLEELRKGCLLSEFQYLNKHILKVEISQDGGIKFTDFILVDNIPLISNKLKVIFDELNIDNLFYKKIILTFKEFGIEEIYWLALPPRINCIDTNKSEIYIEEDESLEEYEKIKEVKKLVINPNMVGNYKIFKLANVVNDEIIITADIKMFLEKEELQGVCCYEI